MTPPESRSGKIRLGKSLTVRAIFLGIGNAGPAHCCVIVQNSRIIPANGSSDSKARIQNRIASGDWPLCQYTDGNSSHGTITIDNPANG